MMELVVHVGDYRNGVTQKVSVKAQRKCGGMGNSVGAHTNGGMGFSDDEDHVDGAVKVSEG